MPNYRKMFFDDPKAFFESYSINLPGNPEEAGKIGKMELMQSTFKPIEGAKSHLMGTSHSKSFYKFKQAKSSVHVSALAHNAAWQVDEAQKKATLVVRTAAGSINKLSDDDKASMHWFLCLMLPWIQNGVTTMQLRKDSRADAFFTGQMNGCSFVVTGDPREPYVSHINCDDSSEYEDKYQQVLKDSGVKTKNALRLGREEYKLDAGGIAQEEALVEQQLAGQNRKLTGIVSDTLCFVMGRRVEGKWEFFYQRVITQSYHHKARLGRAGGLIKFVGRDNRQIASTTVYRAITPYTRLWPDGMGRLTT